MNIIENQLQQITNRAASHKRDTYNGRIHAYEAAKQEVGNLCGWYGSNPDERAYNATMRQIVEVLKI